MENCKSELLLKPKKSEWVMDGYKPPQTCLFLSRDTKFSSTKRINYTEEEIKHKVPTDPCKYSDTLETSLKRNWLQTPCKFSKLERETFTAKSMKRSRSVPGPGQYIDSSTSKKIKPNFPLGKFSKGERGSFISDIQAASQQVPSSWKYRPYSPTSKKSGNSMYHKPNFQPKPTKDNIGPGQYHDTISSVLKKQIYKSSKTFVIPKEKRVPFTQTASKRTQNNPGAGAYSVTYNTIFFQAEKSKKTPEMQQVTKKNNNVLRFTESAVKSKAWVPGPGSYELGPRPKVYN